MTTRETTNSQIATVKAYRHVSRDYLVHPAPMCLGPEGKVCGPETRGLLRRRPVQPLSVQAVRKESNKLEQVEAGLISNLDEVLAVYGRSTDAIRDSAIELLRELPAEELADRAGVSERTVYRVRAGDVQPQEDTWRRLRAAVQQALSSSME